MARRIVSQWDLQEVITEQRTVTRTAATPVTLRIEFTSSPSLPSSQASRSSDRQRSRLASNPKPSYRICIVEGQTVIKEIDTSKLNPGNSEVRIVPPTRATLLCFDQDDLALSDTERTGGHLQSQIDSQYASQNGTQRKKRSLLKLCFFSVSDLKSASHEFMRVGLRCTSLPTADNRSTLSRTSSVVSLQGSSPGSQDHDFTPNPTPKQPAGSPRAGSYAPRTQTSHQVPRAASTATTVNPGSRLSVGASTTSLKRTYSEAPAGSSGTDRIKRRQTSTVAQDKRSPSLLRRESSSADMLASPWVPTRTASRPLSRTPNASRLGSSTPYDLDRHAESPVQSPVTPGDMTDAEEPPPRRELPQSIKRHISRTSSQEARLTGTNGRRTAVANSEVQTAVPFVDPNVAFVAGMGLFQQLADLKDGMIKECLRMTKALGNRRSREAEARLAARYALEFSERFIEICQDGASPYCG